MKRVIISRQTCEPAVSALCFVRTAQRTRGEIFSLTKSLHIAEEVARDLQEVLPHISQLPVSSEREDSAHS